MEIRDKAMRPKNFFFSQCIEHVINSEIAIDLNLNQANSSRIPFQQFEMAALQG